jgi:hypothetical protein
MFIELKSQTNLLAPAERDMPIVWIMHCAPTERCQSLALISYKHLAALRPGPDFVCEP